MRTIEQLLEHIQSFGLVVHHMNWAAMITTLKDLDDPMVYDIMAQHESLTFEEDRLYEEGMRWLVVFHEKYEPHVMSIGQCSGRVYFHRYDERAREALYAFNNDDISTLNPEGTDDANLDPLWQFLTTDPE